MSLYASVVRQDLWTYSATLCVSVATGMTKEVSLHVQRIGAPIREDGVGLNDFAEVTIVGPCDGSCRQEHPSGIHRMMPVGEELRFAIVSAPRFQETVDELTAA